ncbi:MAG: biotin--[acetyl-CoA-carboxylase] ligase [Novosphingobium sp.]|nr:biotin--[acetyl-CoA-carboxylase] ligase [Novosphingobium sp.]
MIRFVAQTGSTSTDLAARLMNGECLPEGDWLVADRQTEGRGRQGRTWLDGAGNFMGSTVVHLQGGDPPAQTLALVAGIALHRTVSPHLSSGHEARLKWPNDLMVGSCKLAGILLERVGNAVVIGIGVNLRSTPVIPGRCITALSQCGKAPERDAFATSLARNFAVELENWRRHELARLISRWLEVGHEIGTPLEVVEGDERKLKGSFAGLNQDGSLQLRLADGSMRAIHAGEVLLAQSAQ